ncbi:hypothetical protein MTR_7g056257 [Medicago truncatula]|uniref:Uncharacterized protein n=1 Tax=Medicago truncatula TaxID=3880 RepID=A0A072TYX4_MEDTR|nr:hypothetical protein MTR_7g056257 [Medicago truncatula]
MTQDWRKQEMAATVASSPTANYRNAFMEYFWKSRNIKFWESHEISSSAIITRAKDSLDEWICIQSKITSTQIEP